MNIQPAYEEVLRLTESGDYTVFPVSCEMLMDFTTPIEALRILKKASDHVFLLESASSDETWGRYSFLGFDPKLELTCRNGRVYLNDDLIEETDPFEAIRSLLREYQSPVVRGLPPFTGGLMGYFSFESMAYAEPVLLESLTLSDEERDIDLMLFDRLICFDHCRQKLILIASMNLKDGFEGYQAAAQELEKMKGLLLEGEKEDLPGKIRGEFSPMFDRDAYCRLVEKARHHILEGDIFQIVLSNELSAPFEGSLLEMYRHMRTLNPSPYLFYFSGSDIEAAGASPETLVRLENGTLKTFPLAGTRPRGKTEAEDGRLEEELLQDEKELAEHDMLVDLGRNDLGRVSEYGSVSVSRLHAIERFSHVMHIGSEVSGTIRSGFDAVDAIASVLPAGTLSGAPKIRACSLIGSMETRRRGLYGGAAGYIDFSGNMDMAIAIRLAWLKDGNVHVRSGAGIVADSIPEKEYQECLNKAGSCLQAFHQAEEAR